MVSKRPIGGTSKPELRTCAAPCWQRKRLPGERDYHAIGASSHSRFEAGIGIEELSEIGVELAVEDGAAYQGAKPNPVSFPNL